MGLTLAQAAHEAGCDATLLLGTVEAQLIQAAAAYARVVSFVTVEDLQKKLTRLFPEHDVLVMAAAVGDFRLEHVSNHKLSRAAGPIQLTLVPTQDVLAEVTANKRRDQLVVSFAVEESSLTDAEAKARQELAAKCADFVVVNTPAAMNSPKSLACILSADQVLLPWAVRPKEALAAAIIRLLCNAAGPK